MAGADERLDVAVEALRKQIGGLGVDVGSDQRQARAVTTALACCLQAACLIAAGQDDVAEHFVTSRMATVATSVFGQVTSGLTIHDLVDFSA